MIVLRTSCNTWVVDNDNTKAGKRETQSNLQQQQEENMETQMIAQGLTDCVKPALEKNCITLLPDLISKIRQIAQYRQALATPPGQLDNKHELFMAVEAKQNTGIT